MKGGRRRGVRPTPVVAGLLPADFSSVRSTAPIAPAEARRDDARRARGRPRGDGRGGSGRGPNSRTGPAEVDKAYAPPPGRPRSGADPETRVLERPSGPKVNPTPISGIPGPRHL